MIERELTLTQRAQKFYTDVIRPLWDSETGSCHVYLPPDELIRAIASLLLETHLAALSQARKNSETSWCEAIDNAMTAIDDDVTTPGPGLCPSCGRSRPSIFCRCQPRKEEACPDANL